MHLPDEKWNIDAEGTDTHTCDGDTLLIGEVVVNEPRLSFLKYLSLFLVFMAEFLCIVFPNTK